MLNRSSNQSFKGIKNDNDDDNDHHLVSAYVCQVLCYTLPAYLNEPLLWFIKG